MTKRIVPISSGKGGVGKTSFAINLALCLSRFGKTVLMDLDTCTSSIRNVIDAPVKKDLYHFFKKGEPLENCIATLPPKLDPQGRFNKFGFIASPLHMMDSITNMDQEARDKVIDGINSLKASFVILDLKAGLDPMVIDFLPQSNTGILVFTPNHPAATMAAADIAKAILFRKFREVFHVGSPIYERFGKYSIDARLMNDMIERVEDVYDSKFPNVDALLDFMEQRAPGHPMVEILRNMVRYFQVYYVLNRFNGVEASFQTAVKPFVESISQYVSSRINISNLGWIIDSKKYHAANTSGVPFVLHETNLRAQPMIKKKGPTIEKRLQELYVLSGLRKERPPKQRAVLPPKRETGDILGDQLHAIEKLYQVKRAEGGLENFEYVVSCLRYLFTSKWVSAFGDMRLFKKGELVNLLLKHRN